MSMVRKRVRRNEDGLSIIGVVIASLLIMLALIPAAALLESTLAVSADNQHRVVAANLATQQMETIRNQIGTSTTSFAAWLAANKFTTSSSSSSLTPVTKTVGSITYTVNTDIAWSAGNFQTGGCSSVSVVTPQAPPLLEVAIKVTWPNQRLATPVDLVSSINPPSSTFSTSDGSVLVSVQGAAGTSAPQEGIVVSLYPYVGTAPNQTLGTPTYGTTDATGCAFFPSLTPGPYLVELDGSKNAGYVGEWNLTTVQQPVTVTTGATAGLQLTYDKAAYFSISDTTKSAIAGDFGLIANPIAPSVTPLALTSNGGDSPTYGPVFPSTTGYETWLGSCSAYAPAASYQTQAPTDPGATTSVSGLQYSTLTATLQTSGTIPLPVAQGTNVDIYVWQYSTSSSTTACNAAPVVIAATTNAVSEVSVNVPVGYFEIAAAYVHDPAPTAPTTSTIDATTPQSVGGPVLVTPAVTVS